jgi:hypothetical protein
MKRKVRSARLLEKASLAVVSDLPVLGTETSPSGILVAFVDQAALACR